jgi:probable addiction module antidote protein
MGKRSGSYREELLKSLKVPREREAYINAALEEGDQKILLTVLKDCAEAMGGITWLQRKTNLTRATLYQLLSKEGNPRYESLERVLSAFHLRLAVKETSSFGKRELAKA